MDRSEISVLIPQYKRGVRSIHQLKLCIRAAEDLLDSLSESHGEVEEQLAIRLMEHGPFILNGLEYSHERRDGCNKVAMRPVTDHVNPPAIPIRRFKHAIR